MLSEVAHRRGSLWWSWNKARLRGAKLRQGAYLLRTHLDPMDPDALWRQYVQLTEVEAAFRALKSELAIRPIWHRIQRRVEAHILVAFLGYCLWICLKQKLKIVAESITPARTLESLRSLLMVEVWFRLRDGRHLCLPRITEPEDTKLCCFIIWAGTCPNSLRPESIPIKSKPLVWPTSPAPEKSLPLYQLLVLLPETWAAVRAARANRLQSSMNLAIGSALACIGLTVPVVVLASAVFGLPLVLRLEPKDIAMLMITFLVSAVTLGAGRTYLMQGAVHLVLFAAYLFVAFVS